MVFSSLVFLYVFLPLVLVGYYFINPRFRNSFLLGASLLFFSWGGVSYSALIIISILFNFFIGKGIANTRYPKLFLAAGTTINLLFLGLFKYADLLVSSLNVGLTSMGTDSFPLPNILLPIGISFYTFQAISYLVDVYRKEVDVQKSVVNLGLYISLFPQLIAGPIVRYHDVAKQILKRTHSAEKFSEGVMRFSLGLAKKILIANNMAVVADHIFTLPIGEISTLGAWIGLIAYSFQIYYDFSGYSDMAIGLAKMFGFDLLENFNFPYIAKSIQEFWRRWHISLSSWFRDYLYIPLGGNRKGLKRTYINLFIVFFATGLWHGANWNFVIWGLVHGLFIVIERMGFKNVLKKAPAIVTTFYTFFVVIMAWVLFRSESFAFSQHFYATLFGFTDCTTLDTLFILLLNREFLFSLIIAVLGAFGGFTLINRLMNKLVTNDKIKSTTKTVAYPLFVVTILLFTTIYLCNGTYNPFIYFRF